MDGMMLAIIAAVVATFILVKRLSFVSETHARKYLTNGALVIDVRSPEEFRTGAVPRALNIPLGELKNTVDGRVPAKDRVLLLHCHSGGRSAIAKHQLKSLGYTQVFNLGSLHRARRIVESAGVNNLHQTNSDRGC